MVERINLIERNPFRLTYGVMAVGIGGILFFCILLFGLQIYRENRADKKLVTVLEMTESLRARQEKLLMADSMGLSESSGSTLADIFLKSPRWSLLIQDIGKRLPGSVWLTGIRAASPESETPKEKERRERKGEKVKKESGKVLYLTGEARSPQDLSLFIAQLGKSPYFKRVILASSQMQEGSFAFNLQCDMAGGI